MGTTYTGWSDLDANAILTYWLQGGFGSTVYVGLLLTLPSDSTGDGLAEPWVPAPTLDYITSVSTGGSIAGGTTRYYVVTETNASGQTTASTEMSYTVPSGTNTNVVTVSWTGSGDAGDTFSLYEAGTSGAEELLASGISTSYYQDTGSATSATLPPSTNTTGYGYQRVAVTANATNFPAASGRVITNGTSIYFPTPTAAWGVPIGVAFFDGPKSTANFRAAGLLNTPLGPVVGTPPFFGPGALAVPFN